MFSDFIRLIKKFILVIGPKAAGKTSILRRLITGEFVDTDPTLGFFEEYVAKIRVIEIGGHKNYQEYWKIALEQSPEHVFFVVDITNPNDFEEYKTFLSQYPHKNNLTLLINKIDLVETIPEFVIQDENSILCSAKTGFAMMDVLEEFLKYKQETKVEPIPQDTVQDQKENTDQSEIDKKVKDLLDEFKDKL